MTVGSMMRSDTEHSRSGSWLYGALLVLAVVVVGVWQWSFLVFFVLLVASVVIHEFGHYLGARWGGMKATEFFVGFGPRIWSFKRGDTEFGIKPILLGGYVKTPGMSNLEEIPESEEASTYRHQPYGRRARMVVAGPAMNLAVALLGFCVFFAVAEEPLGNEGPAVVGILAGGPAAAGGLQDGDRVVSIDDVAIETFGDLRAYVQPRPDATVAVGVDRGGRHIDTVVTLDSATDGGAPRGLLGVTTLAVVGRSVPEAVQRGFTEFGTQVWMQADGIVDVFSPSGLHRLWQTMAGERVDDGQRASSIVGISRIGGEAVDHGWIETLLLVAVLNLALGLFNLLPILPFDGGHLLIATYERIRSRNGREYRVDFAKVVPYFAPLILVVLFVVSGAVLLDVR